MGGLAIYFVSKTKSGWKIDNIMASKNFKVHDEVGQELNKESLMESVPEPDQIKPMLECADLVNIDGRQRIIYYTSSAPGHLEARISIVRKLDKDQLIFIVRPDRRSARNNYECRE